MSSFKGGHAKEARAARSSGASGVVVNWLVNGDGGITTGGPLSSLRATAGAIGATMAVAAPVGHRNTDDSQQQQVQAARYRAPAAGQHCIDQISANGLRELVGSAALGQQQQPKHSGKRASRRGAGAAHNVRLLSIISLIVISVLSRECTARAFLGGPSQQQLQLQQPLDFNAMDNYSNSNNNADKQQVLSSSSSAASSGLGLDYALELGCRNLVG